MNLNRVQVTYLNQLLSLRKNSDLYNCLVGLKIGENEIIDPAPFCEIFVQEIAAMEKLIKENPDVKAQQKMLWQVELGVYENLFEQLEATCTK